MRKIKVGDTVQVQVGKDKGKTGAVLKILGSKVLVEGVNIVVKHQKHNPQNPEVGGLVRREAAIDASNVAFLNPTTGKPDKIGFKFTQEGVKVRYLKSSGEVVNDAVK